GMAVHSNGGDTSDGTRVLHTIGHGESSVEEFLARARRAGLESIVDVRSIPASRRHPQFAGTAMDAWLRAAGIDYRWEPDLGGFRRASPESPNTGLHNVSFRGYADHMASHSFAAALAGVLDEAAERHVAVMCSETLWWRCHRRLIADAAVLLSGATVLHVDGRGEVQPHRVTPEARREDAILVYP
ncbi:MAG: DUF488 family protein, partial [Candidatus Dormibacteria bacterium]